MKLFKLSSLYKLAYLLVIAGLLFKTFSQENVERIEVEGLEVVEKSFLEMPLIPKKIKSLNIKHRGITFNISYTRPVSIISDDGLERKSHIINTEVVEDSLIVNLKNGVKLHFKVDNFGDRLTVSSDIPKVFPTIKKLNIPFKINPEYSVERTELSHKFFNEDDEFHLKLNDNYNIGDKKRYIKLLAENDKVSTLTFSPLDAKQLPIAEQWYMKHRDTSLEKVDVLKERYLSKVLKTVNRVYDSMLFNSELERWQNIPARGKVSENSAIVYLAESVGKNGYSDKLERIKTVKNRYPRFFGFNSSPFLGNIVTLGKSGFDEDFRQLQNIESMIRTSDSRLFNTEIPKHFFEKNQFPNEKLEEIINNRNKESLNLKQLSITLNNMMMVLKSGSNSSESIDSVKEITTIILSKIKWDETGLYLVENLESSSQLLNLKTGLQLIDASQYEVSEYCKPIGEALVSTFIKNSKSNGDIPAYYDLKSQKSSEEVLNGADIYLLLSESKNLPHYYIDKGIKAWTISDSITIKKNSKNTTITISYPVKNKKDKNSHHMVISGVSPYKQLNYKGQPWRAAKDFEKWGVGYYYEQDTQLLYFMPSHKYSREKILITYE